jgi:hypothetical protein
MSRIDDKDLFASGPHSFTLGAWERQLQRRGLPGLDGQVLLDLGLRCRTIVQTGRLEGATASAVADQCDAISALCDGCVHQLIDNNNRAYDRVILLSFQPTTPIARGPGACCDYRAEYLQLP